MARSTGTPARQRGAARELLLAAAADRFYTHGIAATGVDAITAQAGVAKMSLYNNFASKSALVSAYLEARHEEWLELYRGRAASAGTARDKVLAVFDAYIDHADGAYARGFRGCGLLNAAAELPSDDPGRAVVRAHKEQVEQILREHLNSFTDNATAHRLAEHFSFLLEGSMSRAGLEGTSERILHARELAESILDAAEFRT